MFQRENILYEKNRLKSRLFLNRLNVRVPQEPARGRRMPALQVPRGREECRRTPPPLLGMENTHGEK